MSESMKLPPLTPGSYGTHRDQYHIAAQGPKEMTRDQAAEGIRRSEAEPGLRAALEFAIQAYRGAGPLNEKHLRYMVDEVVERLEAALKSAGVPL